MAATHSEMVLYSMTLQRASAITHAVFGNFSAPKAQEIVVARGKVLELLRPDKDKGKMNSVLAYEVFGYVRALMSFRLVGGERDYIVVGSDSGRISILEFDPATSRFVKRIEETFGKSGCRRVVPGQYLAMDQKGRAVMIGAIEKQKFVYVLNRDEAANLTISSPLEAHKGHAIVFDLAGLDVGFENPMFACIEVDYEEEGEEEQDTGEGAEAKGDQYALPHATKYITFYELDLGLNHVTRKHTEEVDPGSNRLIAVPAGQSGPGGVLICAENFLYYKNLNHVDLRVPIPRRLGAAEDGRGLLITSHVTYKQKKFCFFLLQSEYGDLYKVQLDVKKSSEDPMEPGEVLNIHIWYFDTIPPASAMCITRTGYLFAASEFGDHLLFLIRKFGDPATDVGADCETPDDEYVLFTPHAPQNLQLIDEMESLAPIMDARVEYLAGEQTPQIYTLCGRGHRSSLRVLRYGLAVSEVAASSLPTTSNPTAVWAVRGHRQDPFHKYIVVSFPNATIVLSVGEQVTEVTDSGVLTETQTLHISTLGANSLLQIHPNGMRHIHADRRSAEWKCPSKHVVQHCAANETQVVLAMSGGEIAYFELDEMGLLSEVTRKEMGDDLACVALPAVPTGLRRAMYMAVGGHDKTVRLLSLDPSDPMRQLSLLSFDELPSSLLLVSITSGTSAETRRQRTFLYVGLTNGVLTRVVVDEATVQLSDKRPKFLGTEPVSLFEVVIDGSPAVLALSSKTWLAYTFQDRFQMAPLSFRPKLAFASQFAAEMCPEGLVCITGKDLRILELERLGEVFNQTVVPLRYTPRRLTVHPLTNMLVIIESDNNAYAWNERQQLEAAMSGGSEERPDEEMPTLEQGAVEGDRDGEGKRQKRQRSDADDGGDAANEAPGEEEDEQDREEKQRQKEVFVGPPRPGRGHWASCVRIMDHEGDTKFLLELEGNEAAFSLTTVHFKDRGDDLFLAVGTVKDYRMSPRSFSAAYIHIYKFVNDQQALELVHKTAVDEIPLALTAFQGRLLAGVGRCLRIYDIGKKRLLRKCENKMFPSAICSLTVQGSRIYVGDLCESFHMVKYYREQNSFNIFADTTEPRYITASCVVDYDTMAGGDKFGNIWIARLPADAAEDAQSDVMATKWGNTMVSGAPNKLVTVANFHVGDIVTSINKMSFMPGALTVLLYTTVSGGLGVLLPFNSREDIDFFTHLEMHMRQENPPLCGRDHLAFRSYYFPVKDVIDGDLCEQFPFLDFAKQTTIAGEISEQGPSGILKKLEERRNLVL